MMGMRLISVKIPEAYLEGLDILVRIKRLYPNRSEAIRVAIRDLLRRELWEKEGTKSSSVPPEILTNLMKEISG